MKLSIGVITIAFFLVTCTWLLDVANDRNKEVKVTESVSAYNDWECGYQNHNGCSVVFEIKPVAIFEVRRIRYGKDFMAVKIVQAGSSGWIFLGKGVQVYEAPNT